MVFWCKWPILYILDLFCLSYILALSTTWPSLWTPTLRFIPKLLPGLIEVETTIGDPKARGVVDKAIATLRQVGQVPAESDSSDLPALALSDEKQLASSLRVPCYHLQETWWHSFSLQCRGYLYFVPHQKPRHCQELWRFRVRPTCSIPCFPHLHPWANYRCPWVGRPFRHRMYGWWWSSRWWRGGQRSLQLPILSGLWC